MEIIERKFIIKWNGVVNMAPSKWDLFVVVWWLMAQMYAQGQKLMQGTPMKGIIAFLMTSELTVLGYSPKNWF